MRNFFHIYLFKRKYNLDFFPAASITNHFIICLYIYFLNLCICGADIFTFPGILRAITSSLTPFSKSFSRTEHVLSRMKTIIAVLAALPRRPVPGVSFTLYLCVKQKKQRITI